MIKVAVCDDESIQVKNLNAVIKEFFKNKDIAYKIFDFFSGEQLLDCSEPIDIAFLDVEMGGLNGIETAQRLRSWNKWVTLIYVTSFEKYIRNAMTIHPFGYITKPYNKHQITEVLEDYLSYTQSMNNKDPKEYFKLADGNSYRYVDTEDIFYFSYLKNRTVCVHMRNNFYTIKDGISNVYSTLNHNYFIMPNPSFIVNMQHISSIDGKDKRLIMENGDIILISRRKYGEIFEILNRYMTNGE